MSERYTSLELHSLVISETNMADRWLNRLEYVDNIAPNNRNKRKPYIFYYGKYEGEQFWSRYRLTKAELFLEIIKLLKIIKPVSYWNLIKPDMSAHNDRGKPIPADIRLLLTLWFYATGTFQLVWGDLCEIS